MYIQYVYLIIAQYCIYILILNSIYIDSTHIINNLNSNLHIDKGGLVSCFHWLHENHWLHQNLPGLQRTPRHAGGRGIAIARTWPPGSNAPRDRHSECLNFRCTNKKSLLHVVPPRFSSMCIYNYVYIYYIYIYITLRIRNDALVYTANRRIHKR